MRKTAIAALPTPDAGAKIVSRSRSNIFSRPSPIQGEGAEQRPSVVRRSAGRFRRLADRATWPCGRGLFPLRRADDILVGDRFVVALLLALEIEIADAESAGAVVDPEYAAFLLVAGGDESIFARLLLRRALAAAIAGR